MQEYKMFIANKEQIAYMFDMNAKRTGDYKNWESFKKNALDNYDNRIVYMGMLGDEIITEATAIINENGLTVQDKENLVGDKIAYLQAFRTKEGYDNKGYFSKLYKFMESELKSKGFERLTLGVEPCEVRNILIYFNWGFTDYIKTSYEIYPDGEKIIVNYYGKNLK